MTEPTTDVSLSYELRQLYKDIVYLAFLLSADWVSQDAAYGKQNVHFQGLDNDKVLALSVLGIWIIAVVFNCGENKMNKSQSWSDSQAVRDIFNFLRSIFKFTKWTFKLS